MPWIDVVGLVVVGLFLLLGALRGLWWQVFRLVAVVAAVGIARAATPHAAPALALRLGDLDPRIVHGLVWGGVFVGVLALAAFLGRLGRKTLEAMHLSTVDRVGGALAGAVTGGLLHIAFVVVIATLGTEGFARATLEGTLSGATYDAVAPRHEAFAREPRDDGGLFLYGEQELLLEEQRLLQGSGSAPASEPAPAAGTDEAPYVR
jgi:uncharacterized membrane protein required for colicin V production